MRKSIQSFAFSSAKQVTDAYLLGLAVREDVILTTMDKGILHLAGDEHSKHVLLLKGK